MNLANFLAEFVSDFQNVFIEIFRKSSSFRKENGKNKEEIFTLPFIYKKNFAFKKSKSCAFTQHTFTQHTHMTPAS